MPNTTYSKVAGGWGQETANAPVLAHLRLVSRQHGARHRAHTELARCRQLGDGLLHCEVATAERAADLASTSGTGRRLVLETCVGQQV